MVIARRVGGWAGLLLIAGAAALGGCCQCPKAVDRGPLPAAISEAEQIQRLNRRAGALLTLKATGRVQVDYVEEGEKHSEEVDGELLVRQLLTGEAEADVLLIGKFVGDEVFELGENRQWYWMAMKKGEKRAYVGKVGGAAQESESRGGGMPFRADRVLPLLAITPLPWAMVRLSNDPTQLWMVVDDDTGVNRILVVNSFVGVQRELVVDRRSGDVVEVRIYGAGGVMEAVAHLSEYAPLDEAARGAAPAGSEAAVRMPRRIVIEYPSRKARVELKLFSVKLSPRLLGPAGEAAFELPDFKEQGLQVMDVDRR